MRGLCVFGVPGIGGEWRLRLDAPERILAARSAGEVLPALSEAERAVASGKWAAFMLAYESAPAFDPVLKVHDPGEFPLFWAGIYAGPGEWGGGPEPGRFELSDWECGVSEAAYRESVARVRELIRQGETYQVNYTIPFTAGFSGDPWGLYASAGRAAGAGYSACLDMGRFAVLSFSPELFFRVRGRDVLVRPMKGTMPRGRFTAEDAANAAALGACPKNRAENVMIVDLVRSDLGKVAVAGSVRVPELFTVERYPTVLQMTSAVTARLRPGIGLADLFTALFPCGSVTGAPKVRTMEIIRDLEPGPRLAYCGAVGFASPDGGAVFNVPIRTVVADRERGAARFWAGGGVTWDSRAGDELEECRTKMRFLTHAPGEFRLIESLLLRHGAYPLLPGHMARLRDSAGYFGFALDEEAVMAALAGVAEERPRGRFKVRLTLGRGGDVEIGAEALGRPETRPLAVALAGEPVDAGDPMLFHKTTRREVYERARASRPWAGDVILYNRAGEATELAIANLVAELDGELVTPALECGLLPGVLRGRLLSRGLVREARVPVAELARATRLWMVNAVRGWRRICLADEKTGFSSPSDIDNSRPLVHIPDFRTGL